MADSTGMTKVFQMTHPTTGEPMSPVVSVGSLYDKNGNKVDNLLSYKVAGTDVTIPELADVTGDLQAQVDEKLTEVDEALAGIDTAVDDKLNESLGDISTPAQSLGLPSNASIGDLFNTLASVGDLHVWRRTTSSGTDYPVSTDRNAYTEGTSAGTTIEYLGNLGDKSRIATGSYVGTGLQGEGNKTVVPFPFPVKFAVVYSLSGQPAPGGNGWENMLIYTEGMLSTKISGEYVYFQLTENSLKFYCDGLASDQLNQLGTEYCFFGIA